MAIRPSKPKTTPAPTFEVTRHVHNPKTGVWSFDFRFRSPDGEMTEISVPRDEARKPHVLGDILDRHGCDLPLDSKERKRVLLRAISRKPKCICSLTERLGWHGSDQDAEYVTPHETIRKEGPAKNVFSGDSGNGREEASRGEVTSWGELVARPLLATTLGTTLLCAAFAPLLMRFGQYESGILHLAGPSGTGKTTAARIAASPWRGGSYAVDTWNTTPTGLEELFEQRNDNFICLDEVDLAGSDAQSRRNLLRFVTYAATQPKGRRRSKYYSGGGHQAPYRFLGMSTGEQTAAEIALALGAPRMKGEEARMIDLKVPRGATGIFDRAATPEVAKELAGELNEAVAENFGTAGPALIRYIVEHPERAKAKVARYVAKFLKDVNAPSDGWGGRIASRFALIYAAGRIGIDAGILPWPAQDMGSAVRKTYRQARRLVASDSDLVKDALARLKSLVTGSSVIDLVAAPISPSLDAVAAAKAFRYKHDDYTRLLVRSKAIEAIAGSRIRDLLLDHLHQSGIYMRPDDFPRQKTQQVIVIKGAGRKRFFVFAEGLTNYELPTVTASVG